MQWLQRLPEWLARHGPLMLVSVIPCEESCACDGNAAMLVADQACCSSLGSTHLDWEAAAIARTLLRQGARRKLLRFVPGAGADAIRLLFERLEPTDALLWRARAEAVSRGGRLLRVGLDAEERSEWRLARDAECTE